jgi:hypothetical protein
VLLYIYIGKSLYISIYGNPYIKTSNSVLVRDGSDQIKTDVIDNEVWAGQLIDGGGATNW